MLTYIPDKDIFVEKYNHDEIRPGRVESWQKEAAWEGSLLQGFPFLIFGRS